MSSRNRWVLLASVWTAVVMAVVSSGMETTATKTPEPVSNQPRLANSSATQAAQAGLALNPNFTDNLVLQRHKRSVLTGFAAPGEAVTVEFAARTVQTRANAKGEWSAGLDLAAADAQGQPLTVRAGSQSIALTNVLVGDVYLFARQADADIALETQAPVPTGTSLRFMRINNQSSKEPLPCIHAANVTGWRDADPAKGAAMFAAAFHFGRALAAELKVPVGIIELDMGNDLPAVWVNGGGEFNACIMPLQEMGLAGVILQLGNAYPYHGYDQAPDNGKLPLAPMTGAWRPVLQYKRAIANMDATYPLIPAQWRSVLGDKQLPFGLVLSPGKPQYVLGEINRYTRGLQLRTAATTDNCRVIVPGDGRRMFCNQVGNEELLARHILAWALRVVHGKPVAPSGPAIAGFTARNAKAVITFVKGTADGLATVNGLAPATFEVAGDDGAFQPAHAEIHGDSVEVWSEKVADVKLLSYDMGLEPFMSLQNAGGLCGAPWTNEKPEPLPVLRGPPQALPAMYTQAARDWERGSSVLAILDGQMTDSAMLLGPSGIGASLVGPNLRVAWVQEGSPAVGRIRPGDTIYSANGKVFADAPDCLPGKMKRTPLMVYGDAITESETDAMAGKLTLGVRRGEENMDIVVPLETLGSYSDTTPYNCPKTQRIVENVLKHITNENNPLDNKFGGVLGTDALFVLGTREARYLPFAIRYAYEECRKTEREFTPGADKPGHYIYFLSYRVLFLAEYFLTTGDRHVLPYLKTLTDALASAQQPNGGWGKNWIFASYQAAGGYMMQSSLSSFIALLLAREAGVEVSEKVITAAEQYHRIKRGEFAQYGYGAQAFEAPWSEDPARDAAGLRHTSNGKIALGAIAYRIYGDHATADTCARHASFSFNTMNEGYEGNCWNAAWTPLGALQLGREPFIRFMKNAMWYRELFRRWDGGLQCQPNGFIIGDRGFGVDGFYALALLAPLQSLRVLNGPKSPLGADLPRSFAPVMDLRAKKDYAGSMALLRTLRGNGTIPTSDAAAAARYATLTTYLVHGLDANVGQVQALIDAGELARAQALWKLDAPHLESLLGLEEPRLKAIRKVLDAAPAVSATAAEKTSSRPAATGSVASVTQTWLPLLASEKGKRAVTWKGLTFEMAKDAPAGWTKAEFDDSRWPVSGMPTAWCPDHFAVFRTTFTVGDVHKIRELKATANVYGIYSLDVYLNGQQVIKSCNLYWDGVGGRIPYRLLRPEAVTLLKEGSNTLVVAAQHFHRWAYHPNRTSLFSFQLDGSTTSLDVPKPAAGSSIPDETKPESASLETAGAERTPAQSVE